MSGTDISTAFLRTLALVTGLYLLFVVYGSLVPLNFVAIPIGEAAERFANIRYLDLGIQSRADWVANILLMVPLAFLLAAVLTQARPLSAYPGRAIAIWLFCMLLALAIEFTQVFFPGRTVSVNDLIAESLGAALGLVLYASTGPRLVQFASRFFDVREQAALVRYLLLVYLALFAMYQLMPLDLTLSPIELFKKWREDRIVLQPFSSYSGDILQIAYAFGSDVLLWLPLTLLLWLNAGKRSGLHLLLVTLALAALLEFLQLFVYSRVTDSTDIICAALAALLSQFLLKRLSQQGSGDTAGVNMMRGPLVLAAAALLYSLLLMAVFWYPYQFDFSWSLINSRLQIASDKVLLQSLYFGTEYRALTALLQKVLFFMPLGAVFMLLWRVLASGWPRKLALTLLTGYSLALATGIEAMQLALPDKIVDRTDILLYLVGIAVGAALCRHIVRVQAAKQHSDTATAETDQQTLSRLDAVQTPSKQTTLQQIKTQTDTTSPGVASGFWHVRMLLVYPIITAVALLLLSQISALPYNVRELFEQPVAASLTLTLSLYILVLPAYGFGKRMAFYVAFSLPLWLVQSAVLFTLLFFALPLEALYDIAGAPHSAIPKTETWLRLAGVLLLLAFHLPCAMLVLRERQRIAHALLWLLASLPVTAIWYLAVVHYAITDNITELLRDGGGWFEALLLNLWTMLLCFCAALSAYNSKFNRHRLWWQLPLTVLFWSFASWFLLQQALEPMIVKYGQVFSALQFLLSTERSLLVDGSTLFIRHFIAVTAVYILFSWLYLLTLAAKPATWRRSLKQHLQRRYSAL